MSRPSHRRASRVILLDQENNFLLFLTSIPQLNPPIVRWLTPGGGLEPHESHHDGALRELKEETGLEAGHLGEPIWVFEGVSSFQSGPKQSSYTEFFAYRTDRFEVSKELWMPNEHVDITQIKWWTISELSRSKEQYSPQPLIEIVKKAISVV